MAGSFVVMNNRLMKDLLDLGLWNEEMKNEIIRNEGSVQDIASIPKTLKNKYIRLMKNSVQLIGHVGQEPEIKNLEGGKKLANISIATNEVYYKDNGDKVEQTQWHRVTAWGKTAEIIERYVTKGKEIAIEGKLTHRSYDDKEGVKRYVTEVLISEILLFGNADKEKKTY
jgi:single-strand DNA-binding protein